MALLQNYMKITITLLHTEPIKHSSPHPTQCTQLTAHHTQPSVIKQILGAVPCHEDVRASELARAGDHAEVKGGL